MSRCPRKSSSRQRAVHLLYGLANVMQMLVTRTKLETNNGSMSAVRCEYMSTVCLDELQTDGQTDLHASAVGREEWISPLFTI